MHDALPLLLVLFFPGMFYIWICHVLCKNILVKLSVSIITCAMCSHVLARAELCNCAILGGRSFLSAFHFIQNDGFLNLVSLQ